MRRDSPRYGNFPKRRKSRERPWNRASPAFGKLWEHAEKCRVDLWKIMEDKQNHYYILFHKNTKKIPKEKRQFHRQKDCSTSTSFSRIVSYIAKHDKAKQIIKEDYRKLPKSTKRERKHYNHAKQKMQKRESRDKMYRLDQIYKELEHA